MRMCRCNSNLSQRMFCLKYPLCRRNSNLRRSTDSIQKLDTAFQAQLNPKKLIHNFCFTHHLSSQTSCFNSDKCSHKTHPQSMQKFFNMYGKEP